MQYSKTVEKSIWRRVLCADDLDELLKKVQMFCNKPIYDCRIIEINIYRPNIGGGWIASIPFELKDPDLSKKKEFNINDIVIGIKDFTLKKHD